MVALCATVRYLLKFPDKAVLLHLFTTDLARNFSFSFFTVTPYSDRNGHRFCGRVFPVPSGVPLSTPPEYLPLIWRTTQSSNTGEWQPKLYISLHGLSASSSRHVTLRDPLLRAIWTHDFLILYVEDWLLKQRLYSTLVLFYRFPGLSNHRPTCHVIASLLD